MGALLMINFIQYLPYLTLLSPEDMKRWNILIYYNNIS
jgi:hypothetical protein